MQFIVIASLLGKKDKRCQDSKHSENLHKCSVANLFKARSNRTKERKKNQKQRQLNKNELVVNV